MPRQTAATRPPSRLWFLLALCLGACAKPAVVHAPAAGVRAAEQGLEIMTWVCDDASGELQAALGPYLESPAPFSPEILERWRLNGLRLIVIPEAELDRVRDQLTLLGAIQRQWLGESPSWITAVAGPANSRPTFIRADGVETQINPGRMAISVRCWLSPTRSANPALRLEICPNHTPTTPSRTYDPKLAPDAIDTQLAGSVLVGEGDVFVLVPASPESVWGAPPPDAADSGVEFLGPPTALIPTLGEAMLSTWPPPGHRRPKAVVVFIPRVPKDAEIFGGH